MAAIKEEEDEEGSELPSPSLLREQFITLFQKPEFEKGVTNTALKQHFRTHYTLLPNTINALLNESKLTMSRLHDGELVYSLVSDEVASKFHGLDGAAKIVYQVIEKSGTLGMWTKDIRIQTNIQQQALTKIFKVLESRCLIKPVKSVTSKAKKLYMLYHLQPSKELTGGVWYSDLEFDHEFISELRTFLLHCVKRLNSGKGVTLTELCEKMIQANVSRVVLNPDEVQQIVQTLVYDYLVEEEETIDTAEVLYVPAKRVSTMCDFKWWDAIVDDFHFRKIRFEDGVTLPPQEAHYQTRTKP